MDRMRIRLVQVLMMVGIYLLSCRAATAQITSYTNDLSFSAGAQSGTSALDNRDTTFGTLSDVETATGAPGQLASITADVSANLVAEGPNYLRVVGSFASSGISVSPGLQPTGFQYTVATCRELLTFTLAQPTWVTLIISGDPGVTGSGYISALCEGSISSGFYTVNDLNATTTYSVLVGRGTNLVDIECGARTLGGNNFGSGGSLVMNLNYSIEVGTAPVNSETPEPSALAAFSIGLIVITSKRLRRKVRAK